MVPRATWLGLESGCHPRSNEEISSHIHTLRYRHRHPPWNIHTVLELQSWATLETHALLMFWNALSFLGLEIDQNSCPRRPSGPFLYHSQTSKPSENWEPLKVYSKSFGSIASTCMTLFIVLFITPWANIHVVLLQSVFGVSVLSQTSLELLYNICSKHSIAF